MHVYAGQILDVEKGRVYPGRFSVQDGRIEEIVEDHSAPTDVLYTPGLVDSHIHVESSLLPPSEFARAASIHGTVATVSDPHEIANVCGIEGVDWMIRSAKNSPLKIMFGAPSCVPATPFETAGATFTPEDVGALLSRKDVGYLSEVMNFPGVIGDDPRMLAIIKEAKKRNMRVDGHAPGVIGGDLVKYAAAGVETDHECVTLEEARERVACGMKVAIREGSAARNFDALWPLLHEAPDSCFFCSDDRHPDDLVVSHIDAMIRRAIANGVDPIAVMRASTLNPVRFYSLDSGLLQKGDPADFIEVESFEDFRVRRTWINGNLVAEKGKTLLETNSIPPINQFAATPLSEKDLRLPAKDAASISVIVAKDGQLVTGSESVMPTTSDGLVVSDPSRDLLKIVVVNRYQNSPPTIGLIRNFGLQTSAIAGSVAHDSHNIVAVGANDGALLSAINSVIQCQGGLSFVSGNAVKVHPLPIAGLMGETDVWEAARSFLELTTLAKADGCLLRSPFMTLSFMSLLVIPTLKIGDRGYFDVDSFSLIDPWTHS